MRNHPLTYAPSCPLQEPGQSQEPRTPSGSHMCMAGAQVLDLTTDAPIAGTHPSVLPGTPDTRWGHLKWQLNVLCLPLFVK